MAGLDRKWWTLMAVCTATFMLLLDITVVNVALPAIQRSLHSSFSDLQWVGWRWIFFVNVPIGAGAVALTLTRVHASRDPTCRCSAARP